MKVDWKWFAILILGLATAVLLLRNCRKSGGSVRVSTVTRTDTLHISDTVLFPIPYNIIRPDTIPAPVDTDAVITDYFSRKSYAIRYEDTAIRAVTDVTISGNEVEAVAMDYELLHKHTTVTETVFKEQKFALTLGGCLTYNIPDKKPGFELTIGVNVRRSQFLAGYDFVNKTPRIGWQYQIIRN